jgi:hypothetical protein
MNRLLCLLTCFCWLSAGTAQAQWLVYELQFTPEDDSVNFTSYRTGYIVAPANGGPSTVLLTTDEAGKYYAVAEGSARFFLAANQQVRSGAFSALALSGNSQALYTLSGPLNRSLVVDDAKGTQTVTRVAELISGRLTAADDETDIGPAADGSIGMIGSALIYGNLREDLTLTVSKDFSTLNKASAYIIELLEKYGYKLDVGAAALQEKFTPHVQPGSSGGNQITPSLFPPSLLPPVTQP